MQESASLVRDTSLQQGLYRDNLRSNPNVNDYYSGDIPPPHRLSDFDSPYPATPRFSGSQQYQSVPTASYPSDMSNDIPQTYTSVDTQPNNTYSSKEWLQRTLPSNRKSKWIVFGSILGVIVVIVVAVTVGVTVSKNNKKTSSNSSNVGSTSPSGVVNVTNPNDPSTFQKDSRLKQSLYGLAYSPAGSIYPACGAALPDVIEDVQLMSQLTSRVRLYGADCNISALVLEAIVQTKVNMTVWLGNYVIPNDYTTYDRQKTAIHDALNTYGTSHVSGVTVGNEFMLNYLNANNALDPNGAVANVGAQLLISNISDTKAMLSQMSINLPVGTSDAGSYFNTLVLEAVDYGMSNVHPWFGNVSIDAAAEWTWQFFQDNNINVTQSLSNQPQMYIAETGWPSNSSDAGNESNGPSLATEPNLQKFIDTFVCQANANGTRYFFFEFFDEQWKDIQYGGVEGHWGLFYQNKTLKSITFPDCLI